MPLNASVVGMDLPSQIIDVTPRMALAYAAGINDPALHTFDDSDANRFMASPFYCVSPEWQMVIAGRNDVLGLTPDEALRSVHAGQETIFHRPIKPPATVRVTCTIVEVRATKAGALSRTRLETLCANTGEPYATTFSTGLARGVAINGEDRCMTSEPAAESPLADVVDWSETSIPLDRWFPHRYTECADIWNPIHTERKVALAAGLPDIIVHGTALWALAGREILSTYGHDDPQALAALSGRFGAMVIAGTDIIVRHGRSQADPKRIAFSVLNADGQDAVSQGVARLR